VDAAASSAAGWRDRSSCRTSSPPSALPPPRPQVVCATCSGAGDSSLSGISFRLVLIDESSQATEPATLVPLVKGGRLPGPGSSLLRICVAWQPRWRLRSSRRLRFLHTLAWAGTARRSCCRLLLQRGAPQLAGRVGRCIDPLPPPALALGHPTPRTLLLLLPPCCRPAAGAQWLVLAGDPRQLPPTITSDKAFEFALDVTLFDRWAGGERAGLACVPGQPGV
jgi:hypothetical protein